MVRKDLDKLFTEKVNEYLAKGFTINTCSMSGSQGEIAKVDLTDGKRIYRIYMDNTYERIDNNSFDTIHIYVGVDNNTKPYIKYNTIWNEKLELIEDIKYYIYNDKYVTSDLEEAKSIANKRSKRLESYNFGTTTFDISLNSKTKKIVLNKLHSLKGYKSIKTINRIIKYKSNWDDSWKYAAEIKTPNGDYRKINLW